MKSLFESITTFSGSHEDFHDHLQKLNVMEVFSNMYAVYPEKYKARRAVLYVLYTYSRESPYILKFEGIDKTKGRAAQHAELDPEMYNDLVKFEFKYVVKEKQSKTKANGADEVDEINTEEDGTEKVEADNYAVSRIISCINKWLAYQDDRTFTHVMRMKDHYEQVSVAAHSMIKKNSAGEIDWKQKADCQDQANKLLKEIEEWETKLANKNAELKEVVEEVRTLERRIFKTVRPESVVN